MEMENSALMHVLTTQTQILDEIRDLRQKEATRIATAAVNIGDSNGLGNTQEQMNMFTPEEHYAPLQPSSAEILTTPPMDIQGGSSYIEGTIGQDPVINEIGTPIDPTQYAYQSTAHSMVSPLPSSIPLADQTNNAINQTVSTFRDFDQTRMSKEEISDYFANQSRTFQEGGVDIAGKAIEGAGFLSSFAVGGLLPSLAVGAAVGGVTAYAAGEITEGAEDALNYQDIIRKSGYKAFNALESTEEYGGIGVGMEDSQELSDYLRDLAPEKFLEDEELAKVLQGALDNKLLKGASDIKSFKEKFTQIVETTKEVALTLNQSLDEAVAFMGEMERRGISQKNTAFISAQAKVSASMLGVDAKQYTEQMLQSTDNIVAGTAMNSSDVMQGTNQSAFVISDIASRAKEEGSPLYDYIKNNGGEAAVAGQAESSIREFMMSDKGNQYSAGLFGAAFTTGEDGLMTLDSEKLNEILSSDKTYSELEQDSIQNIQEMSPTEQAQIAQNGGEILTVNATSSELYKAIDKIQGLYEEETGVEMDRATALKQMGLVSDQYEAQLMDEIITSSTDEDITAQFHARSLKEEMDASRMAESPSLTDRAKYWWERNVSNEFGDIGQGVSDFIGSESQDIQMMLSGMEERDIVGGALLDEYSVENVDKRWLGEESANSKIKDLLEETQVFEGVSDYDLENSSIGDGKGAPTVLGIKDVELSAVGLADVEGNTPAEVTELETMTEEEFAEFESLLDTGDLSIEKVQELKTLTNEQFTEYVDHLNVGELPDGKIEELKSMAENEELDVESKERIDLILNKATENSAGMLSNIEEANLSDVEKMVLDETSGGSAGNQTEGPSTDFTNVEKKTLDEVKEIKTLTNDQFTKYVDQLDAGELPGAKLRELRTMADSGELDVEAQERADYILNKAGGEYDGAVGNIKQIGANLLVHGMSPVAAAKSIFSATGGETAVEYLTETEKGVTTTKEGLAEVEDQLKKEYVGLKDDLEVFMSSEENIGVSDEEASQLEKYIKSGQIEEVQSMTSNEKALELTEGFKASLEKQTEYTELSSEYMGNLRLAEGIAKSGEGMYDFLATVDTSGEKMFSKTEMETYFSDYKELGKEFEKNMGDMTDQEIYDEQLKMLQGGKEIFGSMTDIELQEIAKFTTEKNPNIKMEELYLEGSTSIDSDKLYETITDDILRQQQTDEVKKKEERNPNAELGDSAETHKEALYKMIDAFKEESKAMQEALEESGNNGLGGSWTALWGKGR